MDIGLIGGGGISETHARAALAIPGVRLAGVYGLREDRVRRLCETWGGTPYRDLEAFLSHRPMELVIVGSPSGLHAAHAAAAACRGLHVLVEKPIDITLDRVDALIAAADAANVALGVCFQDRFKPGVVRMKQIIDEGVLGRVLTIEGRMPWYRPPSYYADSGWRGTRALDGGGALMNQGIHTIDLLLWLGGAVTAVQARTATLLHAVEVEDTAAALLEFAGGALGTVFATTAAYPGWPRRITVTGTEGTAAIEGDDLVCVSVRSGAATDGVIAAGGVTAASASPMVNDAGPHRAVIEDFFAAIRDRRPPSCDGRDARRSVALVRAIYDASASSARVVVDHGR
jgi:UDP-N-acetyl-2-amino-2-deoxyglucuronate dehydrogenase